jgi:hypothetical protein
MTDDSCAIAERQCDDCGAIGGKMVMQLLENREEPARPCFTRALAAGMLVRRATRSTRSSKENYRMTTSTDVVRDTAHSTTLWLCGVMTGANELLQDNADYATRNLVLEVVRATQSKGHGSIVFMIDNKTHDVALDPWNPDEQGPTLAISRILGAISKVAQKAPKA